MKLKQKLFGWVGAIFAAALLGCAVSAHAESVDPKKPDAPPPPPAPAEEEEEGELHNEVNVTCLVTLAPLDEKGKTPEIAGTFLNPKDSTAVNLRLSNPDKMRPKILKSAGVPITLVGEYMKKNTVFLAHDIFEKNAPPEGPPAGPPEGL